MAWVHGEPADAEADDDNDLLQQLAGAWDMDEFPASEAMAQRAIEHSPVRCALAIGGRGLLIETVHHDFVNDTPELKTVTGSVVVDRRIGLLLRNGAGGYSFCEYALASRGFRLWRGGFEDGSYALESPDGSVAISDSLNR